MSQDFDDKRVLSQKRSTAAIALLIPVMIAMLRMVKLYGECG